LADEAFFFITCEHGGNRVPARYRSLFRGHEELLATHRGYDIGALSFARHLAVVLGAPLETSEVTRLLVDLNRSPQSRTLFSEVTKSLPPDEQGKILRTYYHPYREAVEQGVERILRKEAGVIHLSVHSFTPVFGGQVRPVDFGLLYDPAREAEGIFCRNLKDALNEQMPSLRVRRNYPYKGTSDSVVTALRRRLGEAEYLGIEIEINQKYPQGDPDVWDFFQRTLLKPFQNIFPILPSDPIRQA
jgi:predicted N-formylglutamate amidohydrolase